MPKKLSLVFDELNNESKNFINTLINEYLNTIMSLDEVANKINNLTGWNIERKAAKQLIKQLGYPDKDKTIILMAKKAGSDKNSRNKNREFEKYMLRIEKELGKEYLINKYLNGASLKELMVETNTSQFHMTKMLNYWGIELRDLSKTVKEIINGIYSKYDSSIIIKKYHEDNLTVHQLSEWLTKELGYTVTHRQAEKIITYLSITKPQELTKIHLGKKSKHDLKNNIMKIQKSGFGSCEELADYFYNKKSLTYEDLCDEINSHLGEDETPITVRWLNRNMTPLLPEDRLIGVSRLELSVVEYVKNVLGDEVEISLSNREIINPYELDIYLPEKKVAIEINGLYWHSEKFGKSRDYHLKKYNACREKGVQLIQIWEDDWKNNRALLEKLISHKLGMSGQEKIAARKTEVVQLNSSIAFPFLDENHIQGRISGNYYLGLQNKQDNSIVAVIVLNNDKNKNDLYVSRYATSCIVQGGFSKMLNYIQSNFDYKQLVSFSDNEISDGSLYRNNGFVIEKVLPPDYKYIYKGQRKHKFLFRKQKFKSNPELHYQEGLTERELAEINGLYRVYDSGKIKWVRYKCSG